MSPEDPQVQDMLRRSMNVRVATVSQQGVPHVTPLRFVHQGRDIYALTGAGSPAVRHVEGHPGVGLLLDAETTGPAHPVLRVRAAATVRSDPGLRAWYERRAARKYFLRAGAVWNMARHWRNLPTWLRNRRTRPGTFALLRFVPESAEFVPRPPDRP